MHYRKKYISAKKIDDRERKIKLIRRILLIMLLFLIIVYFILKSIYDTGRFTITLDSAYKLEGCLVMFENLEDRKYKKVLEADKIDLMTNISGKWIPKNINNEKDGPHNGDNYIAYTYYIENQATQTINYWYEILIDDVIKDVDEAIRIMLYINDEQAIYAKPNKQTGHAEESTIAFKSDVQAVLEKKENFKPGDIDKITVVVWIEGDDPDCIDYLIGGEIQMHMTVTEEHIEDFQD